MQQYSGLEIAVIGMSGRFPGAKDIAGFWDNLKNGVESIRFFTDEELLEEGEDKDTIHNPLYVRARGIIDDKEYFDPAFFNYTPDEARLMDPQMRLFHECVWEALENAGINPQNDKAKIGLFAGASTNINWVVYSELMNRHGLVDSFSAPQLSNAKFMSTRISYSLDLRGPSVMVDTGCSTSLVAIAQACKSLLMAECGIAIAGGVNIRNDSKKGYLYAEGMTHSRDGHCRAFDAASSGTVGGEGAAVVVLKSLKNALRDGDHIWAIIKGCGLNNDGNNKVGYTAPSVDGQAEAILMAQKWAKVEPESISLIEAHGTATLLGDSIEVEALNRAFGKTADPYCALGSVKTNVGHLDAAAGAAGLIKTVLSLKNRQIPASLHFTVPNPAIDFKDSPFYVNKELKEWKNDKYPLRAGVSSFGIGGTNAHILLEEAPATQTSSPGRQHQLLVVSARTHAALERNIENLGNFLQDNPLTPLSDIAYTLQVGRVAFPYKKTIVCRDHQEAIDALSALSVKKTLSPSGEVDKGKIVFMFPGQGSQYIDMCRDLYMQEKVFREAADECLEIISRRSGMTLKPVIFPHEDTQNGDTQNAGLIDRTEYAQPALFIIEYALARCLMSWGVQPDRLIGHSFGEYVAACISGVFSLEDALSLVIKRGQLMQRVSIGKMLGVSIPEEQLLELLDNREDVSLATVNSSELCVVAGKDDAIDDFRLLLENEGYSCKIIPGSSGYHSYLMNSILADFEKELRKVKFGRQQIPVISNLTGKQVPDEEIATPAYWVRHLRSTVRFADGITAIMEEGNAIFLEMGPGVELSVFVRSNKLRRKGHKVINLVRHQNTTGSDQYHLLEALGKLWAAGATPAWKDFYAAETRLKVPLPAYSFDRMKYPALVNAFAMLKDMFAEKGLVKDPDVAKWFYAPSWKLAPIPAAAAMENPCQYTLLFADDNGMGDALVEKYRQEDRKIVCVKTGPSFLKESETSYRLNPEEEKGYSELFAQLAADGQLPDCIIHGWGFTEELDTSFYSLHNIMRYGNMQKGCRIRRIVLLTNDVHSVLDDRDTSADRSLSHGLLKVIAREYAAATVAIDISGSEILNDKLIDAVYKEVDAKGTGKVLALLQGKRWELIYNRVSAAKGGFDKVLRNEGVYLITGGLGAFGYTVAAHLLKDRNTRVVLTGRTKLPLEEEWASSLVSPMIDEAIKQKIRRLQTLRQHGEVIYMEGDVSHLPAMTNIIETTIQKLGALHGIFHAAGVITDESLKPLTELGLQDFETQFASKIAGLQVLDRILGDKHLDFCLLLSSLAPILGGIGFGAYGPANTFMDHFITARRRMGRLDNWVSINIDGFELIHDARQSINKEEILDALDRALAIKDLPRIIIAASDLYKRLEKWVYREEEEENTGSLHLEWTDEPSDTPIYVMEDGTLSDSERILMGLWHHFFGKAELAVDDDFFELGGDSLKAITLTRRINKAFNLALTLAEFFKRPTIRKMGGYIDELKATAGHTKAHMAIPQAEQKMFYPLSSAQRRLYFLYELDPATLAYVMPMFFRITGALDKTRLEQAFGQLINRHESLRTSMVIIDSLPVQKIAGQINFGIEYLLGKEDQVQDVIKGFIKPFDLANDPLIRVGLLEVAPGNAILILLMHHIITDGVSGAVLLHDFLKLYTQTALPELHLQYKDFSEWQQSDGHRQELENQRDFWLRELSELPEPLAIPMDFKRPAVKDFEGGSLAFEIDEQTTGALNAIAKQQGASMYMLLLGIFNVLLHKLSTKEDIVIGTVTSGRSHTDIEGIIGMFVNTLVLRNQVSPDDTFAGFLNKVRTRVLAALDNQGYQYEDLLTDLKLEREPGRNPLFDIMFSYDAFAEDHTPDIPGLDIQPYEYEKLNAKFDLTLTIHDRGAKIYFNFEYATALFKKESIERLIIYFRNILSAVIADPYRQLSGIDILPDNLQQQLLMEFNDTATPFASGRLIHELFEQQVEISPDNTAIIADGKEYTYRWLNEEANRLAHILRSKGVKREAAVMVIMERRVELIIALLGILKSGGKYIPIEPYVPDNRVKEIGISLEAGYIITDGDNASRVADIAKDIPSMECILDFPLPSGDYPVTNPEKWNTSLDLAYVIFTSGSTGNPKGVAVQHRPVINLIEWVNNTYDVNEKDKILFVSSISFDLSVYDIFGMLATGGSIRIANRQELEEPDALADILSNEGITFWDSAPAMLQQVIPFLSKRKEVITARGQLRLSFLSGDWIPLNMPVQMKGLFEKLRFIALGGATEATVWSNYFEVAEIDENWNSIPYGKPIQNAIYLVLDKAGRLCPIGVPGDLYIGGQCLAIGYINDKELSSRKFIPSPFEKDGMLYNTGDMARWYPDGNIEFLGRKDSQVKIRGFRIELGEIESRLLKLEGIDQALVQVIEKSKYDKSICAYYVSEQPLPEETLRELLSRDLPAYMLPKYFVHLHAIPVTSNGKVNRKLLPAPALPVTEGRVKGPATSTERKLIRIWADLLHLDAHTVGTQDDFFEAGGHSILAVHLMNGIQQEFSVTMKLRKVFDNPTIEKLGRLIDTMNDEKTMTLPHAGEKEYYASSAAQQRLFYEQWLNKNTVAYNVNGFYEVKGHLDIDRVKEAFSSLINRHEGLRTSFMLSNDKVFQKIHPMAPFELSMLDGKNIRSLQEAAKNFIRPFDLEHPSLLRCGLLRLDDDRTFLLVDIHHIICDGLSLNVLMNDFRKIYEGQELNPLDLRYVDYAEWQRSQESGLIRQKEFWTATLAGEYHGLNLPVIQSRKNIDIHQAAVTSVAITGQQYRQVKKLMSGSNVSGFMFFLSAYYILLSRISGNKDIIIATDGVGRSHSAFRDIVGTFINILPLRMKVQNEATFEEFLSQVRTCVLDAFDNQDYPFDEMLPVLGKNRKGLQSPAIEAHFAFANYMDSDGAFKDLEFIPLKIKGTESTQYECKIEVAEKDGEFIISLIYSKALYSADTMTLFAGYYHNILQGILQDNDVRICEIELEDVLSSIG